MPLYQQGQSAISPGMSLYPQINIRPGTAPVIAPPSSGGSMRNPGSFLGSMSSALGTLSPILSVGTGIIGSIMQNRASREAIQMQRQANMEQMSFTRAMTQDANRANSVSGQVRQAINAGVNPASIIGQPTAQGASTSLSSGIVDPSGTTLAGTIPGMLQGLSQPSAIENAQANTGNLLASTEQIHKLVNRVARQYDLNNQQQDFVNKFMLPLQKFNLDLQNQKAVADIGAILAQTGYTHANIDFLSTQIARGMIENGMLPQKIKAEIEAIKTQAKAAYLSAKGAYNSSKAALSQAGTADLRLQWEKSATNPFNDNQRLNNIYQDYLNQYFENFGVPAGTMASGSWNAGVGGFGMSLNAGQSASVPVSFSSGWTPTKKYR